MEQNDREAFAALMLGLSEALERKPMSEAALAVYWEALKHLPLVQIQAAAKFHVQDAERGMFMPKPADLIRQINGGRKPALIAWREVEHAMFSVGAYESVEFEDGIINAVISDMGGWPWICSQNLDEPWTQKEFERRYATYQAQGAELHKPLIGIHEDNNRRGGFLTDIKPPVLITDGGKALRLTSGIPQLTE